MEKQGRHTHSATQGGACWDGDNLDFAALHTRKLISQTSGLLRTALWQHTSRPTEMLEVSEGANDAGFRHLALSSHLTCVEIQFA